MIDVEIKICPFCAYNRTRIQFWQVVSNDNHVEYALVCENCGAVGPRDLSQSRAIEAWNMRREVFPGKGV